jgi:hypothetical protein
MKSLTKILFFSFLIAAAGFASANPHSTAKLVTSEIVDRHLSGFNAINIAGPFDVKITQGTTESVKVEAPADAMDHILTEVNNGVLKIYSKHDYFHWGDLFGHKKILVYVTIRDVNAINISGSGDAYFKDGLTANSLRLSISGSGDMTGRVEVKTLESSISGSGDMKLAGKAETSTVKVVGSGDFTARDLLTINSSVRVSGSGDAEINASEKVDAAVNGSGDVHYTGAARNINSSKTGSGDISRF